ncbi:MAG: HlyD family efflux transporter periplasmic adaptor subunit [Methylococcaceae bacterium]|nr:HlyD family efflux transporter periplasmic adaptor subunit [Methylococcaceae bacterium]
MRLDTSIHRGLVVIFLLLLSLQCGQAAPGLVKAKAAFQEIRLSGYTRARAVLDLATEATGKVERVFAEMGEAIGQNGQFACLDQTFISLDIESNQAEIARTKIDIDYFTKQVSRYEMLVSKNSSSQQQLDEIQRSLAGTEQQIRTLNTRHRELLERRERFCIAAPRDWIVIERHVEPGEWVQTGDPVAKIGNFSRLLIPYALTMAEYETLQRAAEHLEVRLPDLGITLPARVARVSPEFDEKSRKIVLDLEIAGDLNQRRGGIRADLSLHLPDSNQSVLLPESAVDERYEQYWVQRPGGERISVVYLGRAASENPGGPMVRISHPTIRAGQEFVLEEP